MNSPGFITYRHWHADGVNKATHSPDGDHRYALSRRWGPGPTACWIMLNPSTANAYQEDNTSRRVIGFTKALGYNGLVVVNLYSLCSTNPAALWTRPEQDRIGPHGEQFLTEQATSRTLVIAAWGTHGARNGRGQRVAEALENAGIELMCLGLTGNGQPRHPLYMPGDTPLVPYRIGVACDA